MVCHGDQPHSSRGYFTPKLAKAVERNYDHVKEVQNGQRHKNDVDPLPWPHELGLHILDPMTKTPNFWPWPNKNWLFNKPALDAIGIVVFMQGLMKKSGELWTEYDNEFYRTIHAEPEKPKVISHGRNNIALQSRNNYSRTTSWKRRSGSQKRFNAS